MELARRFTPFNLLILSINGMIGSAWLFAPMYAAQIAGSGALMAWLVAGIATTVIALTFAELSVLLPVAGGTAQIPQVSHGTLTSFIISWMAWLSSLTMAPIEVQAVLLYAATYFPSLSHIAADGSHVLSNIGLIWATVLMLLLSFVNVTNFKRFSQINLVIFLFKLLVIILTIAILVSTSFHPQNFAGFSGNILSSAGWHGILSAVATAGIAFAFTGFKHGVELAGESKNMKFGIPLATVGSVTCCFLLYLGLQIAFIAALDPSALNNGWAHIHFAGDVGPFAGLAAGLGLMLLLKFLYVDAAVSPLGAGMVYATSTARILYAMSQLHFMPSWMMKLNRNNMPLAAIAVNFVIGMFLFLPFRGWQAMVGFLVSAMVISYSMGPIALVALRKTLPDEKRAFRLPGATIICLLAFYFCNLINYWTGWDTIYKLGIAILIGVVFLSIAGIRGKISAKFLGLNSLTWLIPYFAGLVILSYLGTFGGIGVIPFGWDFLIIAIFSVTIFYLAQVNCLRAPKVQFDMVLNITSKVHVVD